MEAWMYFVRVRRTRKLAITERHKILSLLSLSWAFIHGRRSPHGVPSNRLPRPHPIKTHQQLPSPPFPLVTPNPNMALVFVHHVIGDLTVGKPDLAEFHDSNTVEFAIKAIGECAEGAITIWKKRKDGESRPKVENFVGILNSLDVVAFIAKVGDHESALKTKVAEVVKVNPGLLKEVDPGTRYGLD